MKYLLFAVFLIIIGCSASKNFSSKGEELYSEKCNGCHRLYDPAGNNLQKWEEILPKMNLKAKLSKAEEEIIFEYISNHCEK